MNKLIRKANVLIEALPYIRTFRGKTIVIKYGGNAMTESSLKERFAQDIVLLKYVGINPVIIHGGGPQIDEMLDRLGIESKFLHGVRVTNEATMEIVEMVLAGKINMEITDLINRHGGSAVGLSGKDGGLILSKPLTARAWAESLERDLEEEDAESDFGFVGDIEKVDPSLLFKLQGDHYIPVIAPIGTDREGNTYNINADLVAGAVAGALRAEKLVMMTDIKGIRDAKSRHLSKKAPSPKACCLKCTPVWMRSSKASGKRTSLMAACRMPSFSKSSRGRASALRSLPNSSPVKRVLTADQYPPPHESAGRRTTPAQRA
jgi:acetylglutamate kinase